DDHIAGLRNLDLDEGGMAVDLHRAEHVVVEARRALEIGDRERNVREPPGSDHATLLPRCPTSVAASAAVTGRARSIKFASRASSPIASAAERPAARRSRTLVSRSALLIFCVGDFITSGWCR